MDGHVPVLTAEVLRHLRPEQGGLFVDCTTSDDAGEERPKTRDPNG